jgi:hypothetical protein
LKRPVPWHPILFAAYPVLSLYSENTSIVPITDLLIPLGYITLAGAALWGIFSLLVRDISRGALAASVAALGFFSFGPLANVTHQSTDNAFAFFGLFWIWVVPYALVILLAGWPWKRLRNPATMAALTKGLNLGAALIVGFVAVSIAMSWFRGREAIPDAPDNPRIAKYRGTRPDIFYVILDGFGRQDALRRDMEFDDSAFIDGLKKRGFFVAESGHANYCQTELSLSSSLNMQFLQDLLSERAKRAEERGILDRYIDQNRVSKLLRQFGYGYIAITSNFPAVHPYSADLLISSARGSSLFESSLLARTPVSGSSIIVGSQFDMRRDNLRSAVEMIGKLGEPESRPRFIFAHILAPHPPFVFGPQGEPIRPKRMYTIVDGSDFYLYGGTPSEYRAGYMGQAATISRLTLAAIDVLLKKESSPPIIIVQGDHGPKMRYDQESLAKTDVNEVFPNLNAYYVPAEVRAKLYPTITPVNSFRTIFREHFGLEMPNLPDRSWYSGWLDPFNFHEVTDRIKPKL